MVIHRYNTPRVRLGIAVGAFALIYAAWSVYIEVISPKSPLNYFVSIVSTPVFWFCMLIPFAIVFFDRKTAVLYAIAVSAFGAFPLLGKLYFITDPIILFGMLMFFTWLTERRQTWDLSGESLIGYRWLTGFFVWGALSVVLSGLFDVPGLLAIKNGVIKFLAFALHIVALVVIVEAVRKRHVSHDALTRAALIALSVSWVGLTLGVLVYFFADFAWQSLTGGGLLFFDRVKGFNRDTNTAALVLFILTCTSIRLIATKGKSPVARLGWLFLATMPILAVGIGSRSGKLLLIMALICGVLWTKRRLFAVVAAMSILIMYHTLDNRSFSTVVVPEVPRPLMALAEPFGFEMDDSGAVTLGEFSRRKSDPNAPVAAHQYGQLGGVKGFFSDSERVRGWLEFIYAVEEKPVALLIGFGIGSSTSIELQGDNAALAIVIPLGLVGIGLLVGVFYRPFVLLLTAPYTMEKRFWILIWAGVVVNGVANSMLATAPFWILLAIFIAMAPIELQPKDAKPA